MSGLERLREFADELIGRGNYFSNETEIANRILRIADEIEDDITRWYLPRPVDADGELFDFNRVYDKGCGAIGRIVATEFSIGGGRTSVIYDIVSHDESAYSPNALRAENPDSIENLRDEIYDVVSDVYAIGVHEIVDEWLKRAEKLFKDGVE